MIKDIVALIEANNWLQNKGSKLSFMKVSTPSSGRSFDQGKVVIFVFEQGKREPTLCVKTVRDFSARPAIVKNYENLKKISQGGMSLFATPLFLFESGKIIFSVETVCSGEKFSARSVPVDLVVEKYRAWQVELAKTAKKFLSRSDIEKKALEFIELLKIQEPPANDKLFEYFKSLPFDSKTRMPELIQHGDMTPDNVLISGDQVSVVDYDYVSFSTLPGFDLFHFLSKSKRLGHSLLVDCEKYFPPYYSAIGASVGRFEAILFVYYLQESLRKGVGNKTVSEIISNFEYILRRT